ncbi:MAG: hypothetical protein LBQ98_10750 [Nitrososphaerota archaeon]|jgi:5S rRNA maturation endonuclease (ribonuclease M5)|nr:hypothetical protein [Nitrososphaerota archaeon]
MPNNPVEFTPEKPKNIKEYLGNLAQDKPEKVISEIQVDLETFIDKIIKEDLQDLYIVGRKARHLFHQSISRLIEKSQGIHFINVRKDGIIEPLGDKVHQEIALLTDSINKGDEIEKIVNILKNHYGCKVNKIFCYVANTQGIDNLLSKKIVTNEQVIVLHKVSHSEYEQISKRLGVYYQSRIEPMDVEHVFERHSFSIKISGEELFQFFEDATKTGLNCTNGKYNKAVDIPDKNDDENNILHAPKNIKDYSLDCVDCSTNEFACTDKKNISFPNVKPEYVVIRLKSELKETGTIICLMVTCPPDPESFSIENIQTKKCKHNKDCQIQQIIYDKSGFNENNIMTIICPHCIEKRLSEPILQRVMKALKCNIEKMSRV